MANKLQLPVSVKIDVANRAQVMKELHKDLQHAFTIKEGSPFGDKITKINAEIGKAFTQMDAILGKSFFDETDFKKINQLMGKITNYFSEINVRASRTTPDMLGIDTAELEKAREVLVSLQKLRKQKITSTNVSNALKDDLETLKEFSDISDKTGFSGTRSFTANIDEMSVKLGGLRRQYADLREEQEASLRIEEEAEKEEYQKNFNTQELAKAFAARPGLFKKKDAVLGGYQEVFKEFITDKDIAEGRQFAQIIGEWMELDQGTLDTFANQSAEEIVTTLNQKLTDKMKLPLGEGRMLYTGLFEKAKAIQKQQTTIYSEQGLQDIEAKYQARIEANDKYVVREEDTEDIKNIKILITQTEGQIQKLIELRDQLTKDIDEQIIEAQKQIAGLEQAGKEEQTGVAKTLGNITDRASTTTFAGQQQYDERVEARRSADAAQKEADTFKANLQSSIKQWMSVREVIGLIKTGIREAYQDIQGLDKAMTNIAVVTDFSVSDLWGKINEYMAVAQQYGVTTQGVYEVSQLYYQQGLGEAETMELTTETLKMARIAGMGYSEAADGMTVA